MNRSRPSIVIWTPSAGTPDAVVEALAWKTELRVHVLQELLVRLRVAHLADEKLHGFHRIELRQELAQDLHARQHVAGHQQLLLAGPRAVDVDGGENAP